MKQFNLGDRVAWSSQARRNHESYLVEVEGKGRGKPRWVLSVLWGWFVIPVFNVPNLSVVQAVGLAMVVSYLTKKHESDSKKELSDVIATLVVEVVFVPLTALLLGWIIVQFI